MAVLIQLMEAAVESRLPPYTTEDDMYEALEKSALSEEEIFEVIDSCYSKQQLEIMGEQSLADVIVNIIFQSFDDALEDVLVGKAPLYV